MTSSPYMEIARTAAFEAGRIHMANIDKSLHIESKKSTYDLVTESDIAAEQKIVSLISERFPDHNFLAEEDRYPETQSPYKWIVDPLDGTNNFAFKIPFYSVSIALYRDDTPVCAAVYIPALGEMFTAEKGAGAWLNGRRIHTSAPDAFVDCVLVTGFYYDRGEVMERTLDKIRAFFQQGIVGIRRTGSAAMDLCFVACGRFAGFWEFLLSPWDYAAGILLIEEAGGRITDLEGNPLSLAGENPVLAAGSEELRRKMQDIIGC